MLEVVETGDVDVDDNGNVLKSHSRAIELRGFR